MLALTLGGDMALIPPSSGGASDYVAKTTTYTAADKDQLLADTSGGAFTITLPASPAVGQFVVIADAKSTWGTNNLTVGRNGQLIESSATDLTADVSGVQITLVFVGGAVGWRVLYQMATASVSSSLYNALNPPVRIPMISNSTEPGLPIGFLNGSSFNLVSGLNPEAVSQDVQGSVSGYQNSCIGWQYQKSLAGTQFGVQGYQNVAWGVPLLLIWSFDIIGTYGSGCHLMASFGSGGSGDYPWQVVGGNLLGNSWISTAPVGKMSSTQVGWDISGAGVLTLFANNAGVTTTGVIAGVTIDMTGTNAGELPQQIGLYVNSGTLTAIVNGVAVGSITGAPSTNTPGASQSSFPWIVGFNEPTAAGTISRIMHLIYPFVAQTNPDINL